MPVTFMVSPTSFVSSTNLMTVTVGVPRQFSSGVTLTATSVDPRVSYFVQMGLTVPTGTLSALTIKYQVNSNSPTTGIQGPRLSEILAAGASAVFALPASDLLTGAGEYSMQNQAIPIIGALDLIVPVQFTQAGDNIDIGAITFTVG